MLTEQEHAARRTKIARRQAAQRVARTRRELSKKKRAAAEVEDTDTDDSTETFGTTDDGLLAGLPELI